MQRTLRVVAVLAATTLTTTSCIRPGEGPESGTRQESSPNNSSIQTESLDANTNSDESLQPEAQIDTSLLNEYRAMDDDDRSQFMVLALSDSGLLRNPPASDIGEASVKEERQRFGVREELIASCMDNEGFEYWPEPSEYYVAAMDDPIFEPGSRDWVDYYGFEISTMLFLGGTENLPDGIHGYRGTMAGADESIDVANLPNQVYIQSLSTEEYDAYHVAYNGYRPDGTEISTDSCWQQALEAIPDPTYLQNFSQGNTLRDLVLADREWIEHEQQIASCLSEQGYEPTVSDEALTTKYHKRLQEEGVLPPDGVNTDDIDPTDDIMLAWESAEWFDALQTVQLEERAHAVAHYDCGGDQTTRIQIMTTIIERLGETNN